jgi:hypothetical protein
MRCFVEQGFGDIRSRSYGVAEFQIEARFSTGVLGTRKAPGAGSLFLSFIFLAGYPVGSGTHRTAMRSPITHSNVVQL